MRRFFFISIPKTATQTLHKALATGKAHNHQDPSYVINQVGQARWDAAYTFAFVRNPWDRLVSWHQWFFATYHHWKKTESFSDWLLRGQDCDWRNANDKEAVWYPQRQWMFVMARDGKEWLDFVGRFENLHADYEHVCREIGRQPLAKLDRINPSEHAPWQSYYTPELYAAAEGLCRRDAELFGYTHP